MAEPVPLYATSAFRILPGIEDDLVPVLPKVGDEWQADHPGQVGFVAFATNPSVCATVEGEDDQGIEVIGIPNSILTVPNMLAPSHNIVSRQEQRNVVRTAFQLSRKYSKIKCVCITLRGSPGIGKSWSALLYIRILMTQKENRRPIIYEMGTEITDRTTYLIYPENFENDGDEGKAWTVYKLKSQERPAPEWKLSELVDFVIDPPQFASGEEPQSSPLIGARGHTFIPASTDNRHLGAGDKSFAEIFQLVLGPYTLAQLEVAFPFMLYTNPGSLGTVEEQELYESMRRMRRMYQLFGGLPRYLLRGPTSALREVEMTTANARQHAGLLVRALSQPRGVNKDTKIASLFFTLRPGLDEKGNPSPMRKHSSVEFVSPGAVKAAGKVVYEEIHRRVAARTQEDSSEIGLAFEHVGLMLLGNGTDGLRELGISARCKELMKTKGQAPTDMEFEMVGSTTAQFERCEDKTKFEALLKTLGSSLRVTNGKLSSTKAAVQSPTGYSNVDGMCGIDVGLQMTLQAHHSVLGYQLVQQRAALGLGDDKDYALIFGVLPERFADWKSFQNLSWKDDDAASKMVARPAKRQKMSPPPIAESKKKQVRQGLRQFVVTLDISRDNVMVVQVSGGR